MAPRLATAMTEMALGMPLAVSVVPSIGSTATSTSRPAAVAHVLAVEQHRGVVLLALADDDDAVHADRGDHGSHRLDGGAVGLVLLTPAHPATTRHRGGLGDAHELEGKVAIGRAVLHQVLRLCASRSAPAYRGVGTGLGGSAGLGDDGPMTVPETVSTTDAPRPSRYSLGSLPNMLRSLLFIGLLVAGLVAIVPRVDEVHRPAVDASRRRGTTMTQTGVPLELPRGLGAGWVPTVATYAPGTEKVPTFTTVWETPAGGDIALKEATDVTDGWVARSVNDGARRLGEGGDRTFERYVSRSGTQAQLRRARPASTRPRSS